MLRSSVNVLARQARVPAPSSALACSACRSFASTSRAAAPTPSSAQQQPQQPPQQDQAKSAKSTTTELLNLFDSLDQIAPAEAVDPASQVSVLRHLSREQVISPQQLSPRHLLQPYPSRPDFSQAFPLGPPTAYAHTHDPFIRYGLDPLEDAQLNPSLLSEFVTSMGKIKPRGKTGLQRKTQRKVGKAIRRARSMGIMPTFGISVPGQGREQ
ncbi:hypothetical protein BMF94_5647 [Rhodotorula taiwanensis]|uniref:Small ribosomal subunit protein bS18m n=1 Tax=Rhodotorula taiwanensis TaxID=741276 RepID=A0A2S5B3L6_9BASI|nr:hypothetical protein BMF94_5647 [Rhodotorula taiwanensis]